jgi:hypothetical protein
MTAVKAVVVRFENELNNINGSLAIGEAGKRRYALTNRGMRLIWGTDAAL